VTRSAELVELDDRLIANAEKIRFFPFVPVGGEGSYLIDADGRRILDFTAGWAVTNTGYADPIIRERVEKRLSRGSYAGVVSAVVEPAVELAARLVELAPVRGRPKVWFGQSGSDANEALARLVRRATGRPRIVSFVGAYHGSNDGSAALSGHSAQARWATAAPGARLPYPDAYRPELAPQPEANEAAILGRLEELLATSCPAAETAALLVEPIQSDGGILAPSASFLRGLEAICRRSGILLAIDEVKVGMGRSGGWFAHQAAGLRPDFVVLGKALGGGLPLSAVIGPAEILDVEPAIALFTTAGNPLSCAAALGVIESIESRGLMANTERVGAIHGPADARRAPPAHRRRPRARPRPRRRARPRPRIEGARGSGDREGLLPGGGAGPRGVLRRDALERPRDHAAHVPDGVRSAGRSPHPRSGPRRRGRRPGAGCRSRRVRGLVASYRTEESHT